MDKVLCAENYKTWVEVKITNGRVSVVFEYKISS